jgi:hypothetical protein
MLGHAVGRLFQLVVAVGDRRDTRPREGSADPCRTAPTRDRLRGTGLSRAKAGSPTGEGMPTFVDPTLQG